MFLITMVLIFLSNNPLAICAPEIGTSIPDDHNDPNYCELALKRIRSASPFANAPLNQFTLESRLRGKESFLEHYHSTPDTLPLESLIELIQSGSEQSKQLLRSIFEKNRFQYQAKPNSFEEHLVQLGIKRGLPKYLVEIIVKRSIQLDTWGIIPRGTYAVGSAQDAADFYQHMNNYSNQEIPFGYIKLQKSAFMSPPISQGLFYIISGITPSADPDVYFDASEQIAGNIYRYSSPYYYKNEQLTLNLLSPIPGFTQKKARSFIESFQKEYDHWLQLESSQGRSHERKEFRLPTAYEGIIALLGTPPQFGLNGSPLIESRDLPALKELFLTVPQFADWLEIIFRRKYTEEISFQQLQFNMRDKGVLPYHIDQFGPNITHANAPHIWHCCGYDDPMREYQHIIDFGPVNFLGLRTTFNSVFLTSDRTRGDAENNLALPAGTSPEKAIDASSNGSADRDNAGSLEIIACIGGTRYTDTLTPDNDSPSGAPLRLIAIDATDILDR